MAALSRAVLELPHTPLTAQTLHQTVARQARDLTGAEFAALLLRQHAGEPPSVAAIASPRLVVSEVKAAPPAPPRSWELPEETLVSEPLFADAASRLTAPLVSGTQMLGTLVVAANGPDAFPPAAQELLAAYAEHAADALRRARETPPRAEYQSTCELIQSLPEGVALCDESLRIQEVNDAFLRICQRSLRDVAGQEADDLLYRLSILGSQTPFWARLRESGRCELEFRNPAGRRSFWLCGNRLSREAGGGHVLLLRETTARHAVQERVQLSEKISALGQVLSKMANQLNNPFQSVIGFADLLAARLSNDPEAMEAVRRIQREARRTAHVLKSLMLYSRRVQPEPARLSVNAFVSNVVREWQSHLPAPHVEVAVSLPTPSPEVRADAFQLEQVLRHVLDHAHRALCAEPPAAGPHLGLTVASRGGSVEFRVVHNGRAIPTHELAGIFEPKFNLPADSRETGLELTVCRDVIEAHGGRLTCESAEGRETVFTFRLPLLDSPGTALFERDEGARCAGRVLVIDDEPSIGALLREALRVESYEPECFTSAREALRRLDSASFDMIVCDLNMPEMSGKEFFRHLRQIRPELASRVIFATGDLLSDHPDLFPEDHPHDVLPKPFRLDQLFASLERKRRAHLEFAAAD